MDNPRALGNWKESIFLSEEGGADGGELFALGFFDIGEGQIEILEGFEDSARNDETREPFVVGGNDVPRRVLGGGLLNHFLVSFLIILPEAALLNVGHGKLPILFGIFEALEEALLLFFLGEMKEEFADDDAVAREVALESVDVLVALLPDVLGDEAFGQFLRAKKRRVDADDEDFLVVRAVEDTDFAALGDDFVVAPEIVVVQFFSARGFEGVHVATLWIDAGHDVLDGAVLSGGIHGLKDEEEGPAVLGVEFFLHVAEAGDAVFEEALRAALVLDAAGFGGVVILQAKLFTFGDAVRLDDARGFFQQFVVFHSAGSVVQGRGSEQAAQTRWTRLVGLEQRTESPAESAEAIVRAQEGFVGKRNQAVEAEHVERVVGAKWDLNAGDSPLELDSGRAAKHAVRGAEKRRLRWTEPVWKKPAGAEIEKAGSLETVAKRNAVFRVGGGNEVGARRERGIRCGAGSVRCFRERKRAEVAGAQAAYEFVTEKKTGIRRHVAAIAACGAKSGSKGPGVRGREKRIAENARGFSGRAEHMFVAAKNAAGNGIQAVPTELLEVCERKSTGCGPVELGVVPNV